MFDVGDLVDVVCVRRHSDVISDDARDVKNELIPSSARSGLCPR